MERHLRWLATASLIVAIGAFTHFDYLHAQTAHVYYVSPTGNDSNPGTELQPFLTIQHAANLVGPGDTVIVEDGIYTATGSGTPCATSLVCLTAGGISGNLVTFKARHVGGAKLDGRNNTNSEGFRFLANVNYVDIEGFELYGMGSATGSGTGFELYSGGHDAVIAHNDIHDIGRLCTDTTNGQTGIFIQQPRVRVEGNRIHDIGRFNPGENGCAPATAYYQNHDHGIYVDGNSPGASDALILNNIFYNHAHGWPIQVYPGTAARVSILNNTFAFPNPYQDGHIILGANMSDGRIINNIFYSPTNVAINYYSGTQTNLQVTKNLVFNATLLNTIPSGVSLLSNLVGDPLFTSVTPPYDFHQTAGSPTINAGVNLTEVTVDYTGAPRTDGATDIGAYEFGVKPAAPKNLRIIGHD